MGDLFSQIAVREKCAANEAFTIFADTHRNYHKAGTEFQKKAAPVCTLYIVHCTLYIVYYRLYIVQYILLCSKGGFRLFLAVMMVLRISS